jgi:phenylalanine-4-hydroxylase
MSDQLVFLSEQHPDYLPYPPGTFPNIAYTDEENGTWEILLARYLEMAPSHLCQESLNCLTKMNYPRNRIPLLAEVNAQLTAQSDWCLQRVSGLTPNAVFYDMMASKVFPSNDFIRLRKDIDYTPAPDIFHETVGHVPILLNPFMSAYSHQFGVFGKEILEKFGPKKLVPLGRIYWFTVEFGLINTPQGPRIYGAGFAPGEMKHALSDAVEKRPFNIDEVAHFGYRYDKMQDTLFVIDSFEDMANQFKDWCARFDPTHDFGPNPPPDMAN